MSDNDPPVESAGAGRIDLHIGVEKTGSSTVQSYFDRNRAALLERGVLYPSSIGRGNHSTLAVIGRDDHVMDDLKRKRGLSSSPSELQQFRSRKSDELRDELAAAGVDRLLLSSEHCSSRLLTVAEVERLRDWLEGVLPGADLHVHVYLRRQDSMHESRYSTVVRMGGTGELQLPSEDELLHLYDFEALLDRWAKAVGETAVHPRRFQRSLLVDGDVVTDFATSVGLRMDGFEPSTVVANAALDQPTQEFLRRINPHVPRLGKDGRTTAARAALLRAVDAAPVLGNPAGLSDADAEAVLLALESSNADVARRWFDGEELFSPRRSRQAEVAPLDLDRAVELAAAALHEAAGRPDGERVAALCRRVEQLEGDRVAMRERIEKLEDDRDLLRQRLTDVRASRSYRLGRALTAPLRRRG